MKNRLDEYLDVSVSHKGRSLETSEFWPLGPSELLPCYEVDFIIDFYTAWKKLREQGCFNGKDILKTVPQFKFFATDLLLNYTISFKAANELNILKTSFDEREYFFNEVLELIDFDGVESKEGKQTIYTQDQLALIDQDSFIDINDKNLLNVKIFKTLMFSLNWAYYYDLFGALGSCTHGPYDFKYQGEDLYFAIKANNYYRNFRKMIF
ncbi:MAG: hypothetical protein GY793_02595 [Proteobacteria bacterium]|nr:hypothetical protein [Pseudomonadota bacterium]